LTIQKITNRPALDKVPVQQLSHLEHRDSLLAIEYRQYFLVTWVRGSGSLPTTAVSAASGCTGLLRAFLGAAAFFGVGIGQLERAGLGCQAKN
jgi:hypothetical protein